MRSLLEDCKHNVHYPMKEHSRKDEGHSVGAIFCHADVKGAYMNDCMISRDGINILDFPSHIPMFSGHFHKPHSVY
jgi:hypothetical protein